MFTLIYDLILNVVIKLPAQVTTLLLLTRITSLATSQYNVVPFCVSWELRLLVWCTDFKICRLHSATIMLGRQTPCLYPHHATVCYPFLHFEQLNRTNKPVSRCRCKFVHTCAVCTALILLDCLRSCWIPIRRDVKIHGRILFLWQWI